MEAGRCGGRKDVESIRAFGKVATCNPAGAEKWGSDYAKMFKGAKVCIVADMDDAGRKHARKIYEKLQGFAKTVKVYEAKTGKDVTDHIEAGHALSELVPIEPGSLLLLRPAKSSTAHALDEIEADPAAWADRTFFLSIAAHSAQNLAFDGMRSSLRPSIGGFLDGAGHPSADHGNRAAAMPHATLADRSKQKLLERP